MRKIGRALVFFAFFSGAVGTVLFGQTPSGKTAAAVQTKDRIVIDGVMNEPAWNTAARLGDFIQFEPERGRPASFGTVVRVLYDARAIYFGFVCDDPQPGRITAGESRRDAELSVDDCVAVCLDTFSNKRNCYYFMTNVLGTQSDGRIVDDGLTTDSTWDGVWSSAARRTDSGWTAEIAIEFRSLKYNPGAASAWGLNVGRVVPRTLETSFWTGPLDSPYRVSQYGQLTGLDLENAEGRLLVIPHVVAKLEKGERAEANAGLDARYALSQAISGDLTINPDFATVEADQEQVNLTRFELNLPEKRNFFLEGSEIYRQRIQLFYSRRIGDIYGGLKLYGKSGIFEFSGMTVQARPQGTIEDAANFSVIRLKSDVMKSSTIGLLAANKNIVGRNYGTAGLDASLAFTDYFKFTGQLAFSYGDRSTDNVAFFLRPTYDTATFHFHIRYSQLGKYFGDNANAVGFVSDDNRRELDSALEKTFWVKAWGFERIAYNSNYNIYWGTDGTRRSWQIDEGLLFDFKNKLSLEVQHHEEYKLYEKDFRNRETELTLGFNTREWQSVEVNYAFGRNFDLDFQLVEGTVNAKLTGDLAFEYGLTRLLFRPDPEGESTWIHSLRVTNYFTKDLFLKVFLQLNSAIEKRYVQVLFVYRFQPPFGLVQLAYQKGSALFGERGNQSSMVFFKAAYMF